MTKTTAILIVSFIPIFEIKIAPRIIKNPCIQLKGKGAVLEVINRLQKGRPFLC